MDLDVLVAGFLHFDLGGGHGVLALQAVHGDGLGAEAVGGAGAVDGDVASADDDAVAVDLLVLILVGAFEELNGDLGAFGGVIGHAGATPTLAADGDVEGFVALLAELIEGDVLADVDAGLDLDAEILEDFDFRVDDVLLKFVGGDAVGHHSAGFLVLLEDGGVIAFDGEVVSGGQTGWAGADDGDLLIELAIDFGDDFLRNRAGLGVELPFGEELLDRVDGDGLVDVAAGAGGFAALVADASANGREGVFPLDEGEGFIVAALVGELQVAFDGDVGRAGGFARSGAGGIGVVAGGVSVVLIPGVFAPFDGVGEDGLRIGLLASILLAELLAEFDGAGGAGFDAAAAGDAVLGVDFGGVGAAG